MELFADVIVSHVVDGLFTYSIPDELQENIGVGSRVVVEFGLRKKYTAFVRRIHCDKPAFPLKSIEEVLDAEPCVTVKQLELWEWIAWYYLCSVGEVCKAAIPSKLRPSSEMTIVANQNASGDKDLLSDEERAFLAWLVDRGSSTVINLAETLGKRMPLSSIRKLLDENFISVKEELENSYLPPMRQFVRLNEDRLNPATYEQELSKLRSAKRQQQALRELIALQSADEVGDQGVDKKWFENQYNIASGILKRLEENGLLTVSSLRCDVWNEENGANILPISPLSEAQQKALDKIRHQFEDEEVCLLHGVTSSGKTEIYIHLIEQQLRMGKQVLYLLPEIALTTQITGRLRRHFGERLGVYHSKFADRIRADLWNKQLGKSPYQLILGARSSVFLPFQDLGLVIIDEEHENSFKQYDPAPRYNAKNTAMILAKMFSAKVLLGTATPSFESYFNATSGKYGYVRLDQRYQGIQLPLISVVDIKEQRKRRLFKGNFSPLLVEEIGRTLADKKQVLLFQNRRGYSPLLECRACGWTAKCVNCDVSLTYHKQSGKLKCHYCGYTIDKPLLCPSCQTNSLATLGSGTEKIESEVRQLFPEARVKRMDLDTATTRLSFERIINDFACGDIDILIGTQMISKGLDFDNVRTVGIINADNLMNFPDFRSHERAFQLLEQVSGRAGRKNERGHVVLQTYEPESETIKNVLNHDFEAMYAHEAEHRRLFHYPPFYRIIKMYVKHKKADEADYCASMAADKLRNVFGNRVLGPNEPMVSRIQTYHIRQIMLKLELDLSAAWVRNALRAAFKELSTEPRFKSAVVFFDVDPQ